ncbi:MAG: oxidoreductase [Neisseriaceae bacterium]|nr:oxidoreductase [Neisseriaceae bacterium]
MNKGYQMHAVSVTAIEQLTPLIKRFTFAPCSGEAFPAFTGGSHVIVKMQDGEECYSNAYSLMSDPKALDQYQISVRLDAEGKGGSKYMHEQVQVGTLLELSAPNNLFELAPAGQKHVLIAGGIGITPFMPQLAELQARGAEYELHYAFRAPEHGALWPELQASAHADRCHCYIDSEGRRLDVDGLLSAQPKGTHVYVCGPKPLIDAVIDSANRHRFRDEYIHWEQFATEVPTDAASFTVVLAQSGLEVVVGADQTILQAIESLAVEVECLCREGVCGTCETRILEGEAEHYDQYLSDEEKAAQQSMMLCVSRAKGQRLVLDL